MLSTHPITLTYVLNLTDRLAKEVLDLQMGGHPIPSDKILSLIDVAGTLRANDVKWPSSLSKAIDMLRRKVDNVPQLKRFPRRLVGHVDHASYDCARGWAMDPDSADEQIELEILVNGQPISTCIANLPRLDVAAAGFGNGYQGFCFVFDPHLVPRKSDTITVRRFGEEVVLDTKVVG